MQGSFDNGRKTMSEKLLIIYFINFGLSFPFSKYSVCNNFINSASYLTISGATLNFPNPFCT